MTNTSSLKNKTALITGASRGIGKAIALKLSSEGVRIIACASSKQNLKQTISEIQSKNGTVTSLACDLAQAGQVKRLAQEALQVYGQIDILINNAGTSIKKSFDQSTDEEWKHLFAVNAMAPFILCRECLPSLKNSEAASIIQIGSVVAHKGYEGQSLYSASKHALLGFTKALAEEVKSLNIRVHAINPGGVYTDMVKSMRPDLDPSGLIKPEEIADIVHFLLTHRNNAMLDDIHIRRANGSPWF